MTNRKYFMVIATVALSWPFSSWPQQAVQTTGEALPFELYKFEPATLYTKKQESSAELDLGGTPKPTGRVLRLLYTATGDYSSLEIITNYEQNLVGQGLSRVSQFKPGISGLQYLCRSNKSFCNEAMGNSLKGPGLAAIFKKTDATGDSYVFVRSYPVDKSYKGKPETAAKDTTVMVLKPGDHVILVEILTPRAVQNRMVKENVSYILDQLKNKGKVALYGVYFDTDKTDLKPESAAVIAEVVKALQQEQTLKLRVGGHTDSTGVPERNNALSQGRAAAVVAALRAHGIEAERLTAQGFGSTQPVAPNDTEEGKAKNRRVELVKLP